jgi:hypothetical protein
MLRVVFIGIFTYKSSMSMVRSLWFEFNLSLVKQSANCIVLVILNSKHVKDRHRIIYYMYMSHWTVLNLVIAIVWWTKMNNFKFISMFVHPCQEELISRQTKLNFILPKGNLFHCVNCTYCGPSSSSSAKQPFLSHSLRKFCHLWLEIRPTGFHFFGSHNNNFLQSKVVSLVANHNL